MVQTGEGRVRGAEFEAKAMLPWSMTVIVTATRSEGEVTESNFANQVGNALPQVPEWMTSLFIDQRIDTGVLAGLGVGGGVRYTGESYGDTANTLAIPTTRCSIFSCATDVGVAHRALSGLTLSLVARNVSDKRYVASCVAPGCYIGQGRSITARLQYDW